MEIAGIALLIVILIVLVILLLKKPQAALSIISVEDFERTKSENESLKISLAKADRVFVSGNKTVVFK